ncbi:MAG: exodeoxyribonuclease III [Neisseriaceae bacterium]
MQITTWNVNSLKVRLPQVLNWLKATNCDVIALQELKLDNNNFPLSVFTELGYHCVFNGQKTYNGVAIISKFPIKDVCYDIPHYSDVQKRVITATINGIRIMCVYVVNGESKNSEKFVYKLSWLDMLHKYVDYSLQKYDNFLLLGDFNIAPEDIDVHDPILWKDQVLCTDYEREKWLHLLELGLYDSFRMFHVEPNQYSWWDYRNFAFKRKLGLRIDHILINDSLKKMITDSNIDIDPRKNERPSDHAPVIISLNVD